MSWQNVNEVQLEALCTEIELLCDTLKDTSTALEQANADPLAARVLRRRAIMLARDAAHLACMLNLSAEQ